MNGRHSIALAAAATCTATLLVGGIAWAAIPGDGGVINACYGKVGGVVRVIDTAEREKCVAGLETPISWNQQGAAGAPGRSPTVAQLLPGDPNCPTGGAAITDAAGSKAFVCGGPAGKDGQPFSGTFISPNGAYSISVSDAGIALSSGNTQLVSISGSDVTIVGDNVGIVAAQDANLTSGNDMVVSSHGDAVLAVDGNLAAQVDSDTNIQLGDTTLSVAGNLAAEVESATTVQLDGDVDLTVQGNLDAVVGAQASLEVGGGTSLSTGGALAVQTAGSTSLTSNDVTVQGRDVTVASSRNLTLTSLNTGKLESAGAMTIRGSVVNIN